MLENLLSIANCCTYETTRIEQPANLNRKRVVFNSDQDDRYEGGDSTSVCQGKITGKGRTYVGQCLFEQAEGVGEERSDDGKRLYLGYFSEGLYHGEGTLLEHSQNIKYVGRFEKGCFHGRGELTDFNEEIVLVGQFENNKFIEGVVRSLTRPDEAITFILTD